MLKEAMEKVSLRQISVATDANYNSLLKASKAPKMGEVYDPNDINYEAIEAVIIRKIGQEAYDNLDWESMKLATGSVAPLDLQENVGDRVTLRGNDAVYEVAIKTATHIVLMPVDTTNTQPRVMSNFTFKHSGGKVCV